MKRLIVATLAAAMMSLGGITLAAPFPYYNFTLMTQYNRSLNYDMGSGTSMASPIVAAVAALVWSKNGGDNKSVRYTVEHTADNISGTGTYWTYGRVNACRAVGCTPPPS